MVFPSRTNVTLNFLVAGVYCACSIYGFCPPIAACSSSRNLYVLDPLAFERSRQGAVHHTFRQRQGRLVELVNARPHKLVVAARHGLAERGRRSLDGAALRRVEVRGLLSQGFLGGRQVGIDNVARLDQLPLGEVLLG